MSDQEEMKKLEQLSKLTGLSVDLLLALKKMGPEGQAKLIEKLM